MSGRRNIEAGGGDCSDRQARDREAVFRRIAELTPVPGSTLADADERSTLTFVALVGRGASDGSRSTAARDPINQAILVAELSFPEPKKRLCACQRTPHNSEPRAV
jgi:hypothetical protein